MFHKLMIGNDHGGLEAKRFIVQHLNKNGYEAINVGSDTEEIVRYPYYAALVAGGVSRGEAEGGILVCSTGIGMSIVANKFKGIRASVCTSHYTAMMTRKHNDSNILCLGGKTLGLAEIGDILEAWLKYEYEGGRHMISLAMIADGEDRMLNVCDWYPPKDMYPSSVSVKTDS
jgi:ribose 5-phosphate isomerase B